MAKAYVRVYRGTTRNLKFLAGRLRAGEVVAVPTETVYGLAANALKASACRKIFRAKGRPLNDPLIVHLHSMAGLPQVCEANSAALKLARKFWPGPLTLVLPKKSAVPAIVSAGRESVAVRVPAHRLFRRLLQLAGLPLAAPSANPFGYISPTTAGHVRQSLGKKIRHILNGGPSRIGVESTIVDLRNPAKPRVLRPGAISREALAATLGCKVGLARRSAVNSREVKAQVAPGLLERHYSPRTPVVLHQRIATHGDARCGYIFFRRPAGPARANIFWLDARGDLAGAARRLFATLRRADERQFSQLHVELAPAAGGSLGIAINDRLRRAASR